MAEVEVDEVLCLCACRHVSIHPPLKPLDKAPNGKGKGERGNYEPWVTKLPKFRPTIQCHVGPLRSSNVFLMCCAMSFSMLNLSIASCAAGVVSRGASAGRMMALWALDRHGLGERTDLDSFLLHLVAHVGGLDLGCSARLVLARLSGTFDASGRRAVVEGTREGSRWGTWGRTIDLVL